MPNGKKFCEMDLLLEISKHYSFEGTVIIAMHVLRRNGVKITFNGLEAILKQLANGTVYIWGNQNNASNYNEKMQKIHESHKALNVNTAKYSDIYKNMSDENASDRIKSYVLYDLILQVCKDTFDNELTVLIATYALRHSGLNVTVASVEDTFNQMIQRSLTIGNDHMESF